MDVRRLEAFQAVARELSFTRAAQSLHVSQSAVSQQIAALEVELEGPLFDRSQRRVRLTPAGVALLSRVDDLLGQIAEARRAVAAARGLVEGDLRVSASRTIGAYLLPRALASLERRHPSLRLRVSIDNSEQVVAALRRGAADIGFVEDEVDRAGIALEQFHEDELVLVVGVSHRLSDAPEVTFEDLIAEPTITREPGSGTRRVAEDHLAAAGIDPSALNVVAELSEIEAIKSAVEAGLGIAVVSRATLSKELALGTLVARTLPGGPLRRRLAAVTISGASELPAARELLGLLGATARA